MRNPFLFLSFALSTGILVYPYLDYVRLVWIWKAFAVCLFGLWLSRGKKAFLPLLILTFALLGFLRAQVSHSQPWNAVQHFSSEERLAVTGTVKTQPELKTRGRKQTVSFVLASHQITDNKSKQRKTIPVNGAVQVFLHNPEVIPNIDDIVRLYGTLKRPKMLKNPGEFDYAGYLAGRNIYAIFSGYGKYSVRTLQPAKKYSFVRFLEFQRSLLEKRIEKFFSKDKGHEPDLKKAQMAPILKALILGKRKELDYDLRDAFLRTGTAHILATQYR